MFNSRWALSSFAALLLYASPASAVTISTDTVIGVGSPLNGETITVVDGGDGPTAVQIIEGGTIKGFAGTENSHLILYGGESTFPSSIFDSAKLTMRSGTIACTNSVCGTVTISGIFSAFGESQLHVFGGQFGDDFTTDLISLHDQSEAHIYGRNLSITGPGIQYTVSGVYGDGSSFELTIDTELGRSQILLHQVPEPNTTAIVLSSACVFLRLVRFC